MSILAQRESIAFVRLECSACSTQILALVTGAPTDDGIERTEWTAIDQPAEVAEEPSRDGFRVGRPPIDEDDVQAMHEFLDGYQGDIRSLLTRPGRAEDR